MVNNYSLKLSGAYVELTTACNASCPYCYNDSGKSNVSLKSEYVYEIIDELVSNKLFAIVFSGGEPFLHPEIYKLIKYAEDKNVRPTIITNLMLLCNDDIKALLNRKITLQITFDNIIEEKHDLIRSRGNYEKIMFLLNFAQIENLTDNLSVRINLSKSNYLQINDFINLLKGYNIKKATFSFLHKSGRGLTYNDVFDYKNDVMLLTKILNYLEEIKEKVSDTFTLTYGELNKSFGCAFFANEEIDCLPRIDPYGNVYMCQIFTGDVNVLGNVKENSLSDVLCSEKCINIINNVRERKHNIKKCKNCPFEDLCMGGCPAVAYNSTSSYDVVDSQCTMIRYTMKNILKANIVECFEGLPK
ncbi:MAG: radical SAM protein [Clostridia bacterium]